MTRILNKRIKLRIPYYKEYPLQEICIYLGIISFILLSLISVNFGLCFSVILCIIGILWNKNEVPILPVCFFLQWLTIAPSYLYWKLSGIYPGMYFVGNIEKAAFLSLLGLLVVALGIRLGLKYFKFSNQFIKNKLDKSNLEKKISILFWFIIGFNTLNWFVSISPASISYSYSQIIYNIFEFRLLLYILLMLIVFRYRTGYLYLFIAFLFVLIPNFTSRMSSGFMDVLIISFVGIISFYNPMSNIIYHKKHNKKLAFWAIVVFSITFTFALLWVGSVKPAWRYKLKYNLAGNTQQAKLSVFFDTVQEEIPHFKMQESIEILISRVGSGFYYFTFVVDMVPNVVSYENGFLTIRALKHVIMPRFIFSDKENLGGDSWIVRKYAGIDVSGEESDTSVGLGYIPEFYIDFGIYWMFVPLFLFGIIISILFRSIILFSPSYNFYSSCLILLFINNFTNYEGEIAKIIGGLLMSYIIFSIMLYTIGSICHRYLRIDKKINNRNPELLEYKSV